jgi:hypothetical protein
MFLQEHSVETQQNGTGVGSTQRICHPERSMAIGFINRHAQSRDLLFPA